MKQPLWQTDNGTFIGLDHAVKLGSKGTNVTDYYHESTSTAITTVHPATHRHVTAIYDITGKAQQKLMPGLNLVKYSDGEVKKVMK